MLLRERARQGVEAGIVAAAGTAGALLGFGHAHGTTFSPLNAVAGLALGGRATLIEGFDPVVTTVGALMHVGSVVLWGILFALLAWRARGARLLAVALLFAGAAFLIDYRLAPARLRPGFEGELTAAELAAVYLVLALSLAAGLALARSVPVRETHE